MGETEVKVSGLIVGATGVYVLLLVDTPFPVGWSFRLPYRNRLMFAEVDHCQQDGDKYLVGIDIRRTPPQYAARPC